MVTTPFFIVRLTDIAQANLSGLLRFAGLVLNLKAVFLLYQGGTTRCH